MIHLSAPLGYEDGLRLQDQAVAALLDGTGGEVVYVLEHRPVYTIGRLRDQSSLRDAAALPHPVYETNRGGQATYHGPGQLTGYPILDLSLRGRDLHDHLRALEEALIRGCAALGLQASRRENLTGVWVGERKLASIGVGVRKWITMHGFALNVTRECLPPFGAITPCGLGGVTMTSLETELGRAVGVGEIVALLTPDLEKL